MWTYEGRWRKLHKGAATLGILLTIYDQANENKEDGTGGEQSTHEKERIHTNVWWEYMKERANL